MAIQIRKQRVVLSPRNLSFVVFSLILSTSSCNEQDYTGSDGKPDGQKIYSANCTSCHGDAGDAGAGGAKNLKLSSLDEREVKAIIMNGKGAMMPFKSLLKQSEIDAVTAYAISLRN
jgi:mono/diheme cytochrome c family protein